jgi:hypothetical protein
MPVVIICIKMERQAVEEQREDGGANAKHTEHGESARAALCGKIREQKKSYGQPEKRKANPWENREDPWLGRAVGVHTIDVRFDGPG